MSNITLNRISPYWLYTILESTFTSSTVVKPYYENILILTSNSTYS